MEIPEPRIHELLQDTFEFLNRADVPIFGLFVCQGENLSKRGTFRPLVSLILPLVRLYNKNMRLSVLAHGPEDTPDHYRTANHQKLLIAQSKAYIHHLSTRD